MIVDISGYTQFLHQRNLSLLHAEDIITQLLESVIDDAEYPLILNKLEGDIAFLYALMDEDHAKVAQDILQQTLAFFPAFHRKAAELSLDTAYCKCDACTQISRLRLKTFLHHGKVVLKKIRHFEELVGEHVILTHRLLKNAISSDEYILITNDFSKLTGIFLSSAKKSIQKNTKTQQLLARSFGFARVEIFSYIPNEKISLLNFLKKTLGF